MVKIDRRLPISSLDLVRDERKTHKFTNAITTLELNRIFSDSRIVFSYLKSIILIIEFLKWINKKMQLCLIFLLVGLVEHVVLKLNSKCEK